MVRRGLLRLWVQVESMAPRRSLPVLRIAGICLAVTQAGWAMRIQALPLLAEIRREAFVTPDLVGRLALVALALDAEGGPHSHRGLVARVALLAQRPSEKGAWLLAPLLAIRLLDASAPTRWASLLSCPGDVTRLFFRLG